MWVQGYWKLAPISRVTPAHFFIEVDSGFRFQADLHPTCFFFFLDLMKIRLALSTSVDTVWFGCTFPKPTVISFSETAPNPSKLIL